MPLKTSLDDDDVGTADDQKSQRGKERSKETVTDTTESGCEGSLPKPTRTAMGEYIVPSDGKPLTSLGDHYPGPSDYTPKIDLTKPSPPQYSIVGKLKRSKDGKKEPGPADYDTTGDLIWKDKNATLKGRGKSYLETPGSSDTVGPDKYKVEYFGFGKGGPKHKIANKQPGDMYTGPPNKLVAPVDTHGFSAPGPGYRPNSSHWGKGPKPSFGGSHKVKIRDGPGPADYDLPEESRVGPAYSLGCRLPPTNGQQTAINKESPAANTYNLGTTIGKTTAVSITGRSEVSTWDGTMNGPSPNAYSLKDSFTNSKKGVTLAYRRFEENEPVRPGPADYSIQPVNLKKNPAYSCGHRTNPAYPTTLNYVTKSQEMTPGPGSYDLVNAFGKNDRPAFSIGKRCKTPKRNGPGPNAYKSHKKDKIGAERAPAYSIGKRIDKSDSTASPGPAAYFPSIATSSPKFSITKRPKSRKGFVNPAPNSYALSTGQTVSGPNTTPGIRFKSRGSPYIYSGFTRMKLTEPTIA